MDQSPEAVRNCTLQIRFHFGNTSAWGGRSREDGESGEREEQHQQQQQQRQEEEEEEEEEEQSLTAFEAVDW